MMDRLWAVCRLVVASTKHRQTSSGPPNPCRPFQGSRKGHSAESLVCGHAKGRRACIFTCRFGSEPVEEAVMYVGFLHKKARWVRR